MGENDSADKNDARARWPALESNPDSFTEFIRTLGVPSTVALHDVFGFEPELLMMIPQPIYAMVFLFPHEKAFREPRDWKTDEPPKADPGEPYFLWQSKALGNACGTIACMHALINKRSEIPFDDGSVLGQFLEKTKDMNAKERGACMESYEPIREKQQKSARSGNNQTQVNEGKVDFHFVCFIEHNGYVYELDGAKPAPVKHCKVENFPADVGKIIQTEYMAKMPGELNFSTLALAPMEQ